MGRAWLEDNSPCLLCGLIDRRLAVGRRVRGAGHDGVALQMKVVAERGVVDLNGIGACRQ